MGHERGEIAADIALGVLMAPDWRVAAQRAVAFCQIQFDADSVELRMLVGQDSGEAVRVVKRKRAGSSELSQDVSRTDGAVLATLTVQGSGFAAGDEARLRDVSAILGAALERWLSSSATMLDGLPEFVWATDADGRLTYVGTGMVQRLGYRGEDLRGRKLLDFVHRDDAATVSTMLAGFKSGQAMRSQPLRLIAKLGNAIDLLWSSGPLLAGMSASTAIDVTTLKERDGARREEERLLAVSKLAGGIAHDYNNLLTVVLGGAELLREQLAGDPDKQQLADLVRSGAERCRVLTSRLLAFGRRQVLHPEPTDLNSLLVSRHVVFQDILGDTGVLEFRLADGLAPALVDPVQFEVALGDLIANARYAMPDGGTVTIATARPAADKTVTVTISDTGHGMTAKVLARATEPFFTTRPVGQGCGLGLSMVEGFMRQSGGALGIASEPGRGTTVELSLPTVAR